MARRDDSCPPTTSVPTFAVNLRAGCVSKKSKAIQGLEVQKHNQALEAAL